jgi:hypothetical protein
VQLIQAYRGNGVSGNNDANEYESETEKLGKLPEKRKKLKTFTTNSHPPTAG